MRGHRCYFIDFISWVFCSFRKALGCECTGRDSTVFVFHRRNGLEIGGGAFMFIVYSLWGVRIWSCNGRVVCYPETSQPFSN